MIRHDTRDARPCALSSPKTMTPAAPSTQEPRNPTHKTSITYQVLLNQCHVMHSSLKASVNHDIIRKNRVSIATEAAASAEKLPTIKYSGQEQYLLHSRRARVGGRHLGAGRTPCDLAQGRSPTSACRTRQINTRISGCVQRLAARTFLSTTRAIKTPRLEATHGQCIGSASASREASDYDRTCPIKRQQQQQHKNCEKQLIKTEVVTKNLKTINKPLKSSE